MSKTWGFFLVAQDMVLSHRAKFQLIINFFRVCMNFVVFLPDYKPFLTRRKSEKRVKRCLILCKLT